MSALNDTLTEREVQYEWDLHARQWETEHMDDDDIMKLRAETSRMPRRSTHELALQRLRERSHVLRPRTQEEWANYFDDCDQEEER